MIKGQGYESQKTMPSWVYALFECWLLFVFALCHGVWDGGPKFFFPWRIPTPHQCAKFQTTTRGWGGRIFWIFSNLPTRVRGPKRVCVSRKTDEWYRSDSCAILSTNGAKSVYGGSLFDICPQLGRRCPQTWPKFTPCCGRFRDFELPPPNWPLNIIGLGTLIKTNFVWGIALHLGEIWGLKFSTGVYFGPDFPETPSSDFGIFGPSTAAPPLGMLNIWAKSDEQNSRNVRSKLVPQPSTFLFRPILRARVQPRSDCPRSTPTTQSVFLVCLCMPT